MKRVNREEYNKMQPLNIGDTIICKGNKWVVGKILSQKVVQGTPKREGRYLINFEDNMGSGKKL